MSIRLVQQKLAAAGFNPGAVDGLWGRATEAALDAALASARGGPASAPADVLRTAILPALRLQPASMDTPEARVLMLAICGQEADFRHRWQVVDRTRPGVMGPARGLWQFERGGGTRGVLTHERTRAMAADVCRLRAVAATTDAVYNALHRDDVLAAAFARLLCWSSPKALPATEDVEGAWQFYLREWRPGAYTNGTARKRGELRAKWASYHAQARAAAGLH